MGHLISGLPPLACNTTACPQMMRSDAAFVKCFLEERAAAEAAAVASADGAHNGSAGGAADKGCAEGAARQNEGEEHAPSEAAPLLPPKLGSVDSLCGGKGEDKEGGIVPFWLPPERMPAPYSGQHLRKLCCMAQAGFAMWEAALCLARPCTWATCWHATAPDTHCHPCAPTALQWSWAAACRLARRARPPATERLAGPRRGSRYGCQQSSMPCCSRRPGRFPPSELKRR